MQEGETSRTLDGGRQLKFKPSGAVRERIECVVRRAICGFIGDLHPETSSAFQELLAFCKCMRQMRTIMISVAIPTFSQDDWDCFSIFSMSFISQMGK